MSSLASEAWALRPESGGWHPVEWLCELVGTFFQLSVGLAIVVALESPLSPLHEALPWQWLRLVLMGAELGLLATLVAVSPLGRRSGAHLNPSVTIGFWARGQTHVHDLIGFVAAQCIGATLAAAAVVAVIGSWEEAASFARTAPRPGLPWWVTLLIEVALTFGLVFVILVMVSSSKTVRWTPLGAAAALMVLIPVGGPPTGASMNPARTLGPDVVSATFPSLWIYAVGPALGALLAAAAFPLLASGRDVLTAKLFHDERHPSVHASRLPDRPR